MDFSFTDDQEALRSLARAIFADHCTHDRLKEIEHEPDRFDRGLWSELERAGLTDATELGFIEICIILEEAGRAVAPVPIWSSLVGGMAARDAAIYALALEEPPGTYVRRDGDTPSLSGVKTSVPAATVAAKLVVSAGEGVFLVDPRAPGLRIEPQETTSREIRGLVTLDNVAVEAELDVSAPWLVERATAALCAMQAGVCDRAVRMTAEYTSQREQFDRKLAAFQAVSQRAADAYIDAEAIRLTAWQAVWRLSEGLPAAREVAVAKFWASEGAQRVVHAAQHLHGGIGVDVDYPLHRYFLWAKQIELTLGAGTPQLVRLGALL